MLLLNPDNLGEQAINKLATFALQSQFRSAQRLDVQVRTDPSLLAQGRLASLAVEGSGLVLACQTRLQGLQLHLHDIAVSPFKALFGSIELTAPTQGTARLVLSDADCERLLAADSFAARCRCQCRADGTLAIALDAATLILRPRICPQRERATCDLLEGEPAAAAEAIARLERCLNLETFTLPGLSLRPHGIRVVAGCLAIQARAQLTHFPSASGFR